MTRVRYLVHPRALLSAKLLLGRKITLTVLFSERKYNFCDERIPTLNAKTLICNL